MLEKKRVMVVDDDADFVELTRTVLEANGYEVVAAYNGEECLDKLHDERADVIVLDAMMSTRSEGFNVSRDLRNSDQTKGIPIIMVTSINQTVPFKFEPDPTWLPVDVLLEKPVDPERLLDEINKLLKASPVCSG